jgi:glycosyltransferase involved in cell wall biosynthesis
MSDPFFSIVTVTLNCRQDALLTARSLWSQEGASYEYVVKDGMSGDGTPEAIRRAGKAVVRVQRDSGIFDAMNQALRYCTGRYVLFLNAGDILVRPDALSVVGGYAMNRGFPEILYTHYIHLLQRAEIRHPSRPSRFYLFRGTVCHQATYVRRDCYESFGGFDLSFPVLADDEMLARLVCGHGLRAELCPIVSVAYKGGGFSSTPTNVRWEFTGRRRIQERYFSCAERLLFRAVLLVTLHPLRDWLLHSFRSRLYARAHRWVSNRLVGGPSVPAVNLRRVDGD